MATILSKLVKIKDQKTGYVQTWNLYPAQKQVLKAYTQSKQVIICKARQVGLSTVTVFYAAYKSIIQPGISIAIAAHNFQTSIKLVNDLKEMLEQLGVAIISCSKFHINLANG